MYDALHRYNELGISVHSSFERDDWIIIPSSYQSRLKTHRCVLWLNSKKLSSSSQLH